MTTRREEQSKRRGPRARSSREEASAPKKKAARRPREAEPLEAVRVPERPAGEGDALRDVLFDLWSPQVAPRVFGLALDVRETRDALLVEAELPGVDPDDVAITLHGDLLRLEGEKTWREVRDDELVHALERGVGRFARTFRLPWPVAEDAVEAWFDEGVLTVRVRKPTSASSRRVAVRRASLDPDLRGAPIDAPPPEEVEASIGAGREQRPMTGPGRAGAEVSAATAPPQPGGDPPAPTVMKAPPPSDLEGRPPERQPIEGLGTSGRGQEGP